MKKIRENNENWRLEKTSLSGKTRGLFKSWWKIQREINHISIQPFVAVGLVAVFKFLSLTLSLVVWKGGGVVGAGVKTEGFSFFNFVFNFFISRAFSSFLFFRITFLSIFTLICNDLIYSWCWWIFSIGLRYKFQTLKVSNS